MRARGLRICVFSIFGQFYDWFLVLSYFLGVLAAILMMPTCSLCSRPFKTRGTLARHRQLFHNGKSMDDTVPSIIVSLPYFVKQGVPTSQASSTFSAPYSPTRSKSSAKVSPLPHPQKFRLMSASLFHLLCWATEFVRIPVRPLLSVSPCDSPTERHLPLGPSPPPEVDPARAATPPSGVHRPRGRSIVCRSSRVRAIVRSTDRSTLKNCTFCLASHRVVGKVDKILFVVLSQVLMSLKSSGLIGRMLLLWRMSHRLSILLCSVDLRWTPSYLC